MGRNSEFKCVCLGLNSNSDLCRHVAIGHKLNKVNSGNVVYDKLIQAKLYVEYVDTSSVSVLNLPVISNALFGKFFLFVYSLHNR